MDKSTLSQYGWVIIVIIVIAILLGFSGPFAMFVKDTVFNTTIALGEKIDIPGPGGKPKLEYYIGKTKPEYVKATFNEDFTEVVITKNGEDSDGKMKDFKELDEPDKTLSQHRDTVKKIIVEEGVTSIGWYAFAFYSNAVQLQLPDSLKTVDFCAFNGCNKIEEINLPDNIEYIGDYAFYTCRAVSDIYIPATVSYIGGAAFGDLRNCPKIIVNENNPWYNSVDGVVYNEDFTTLVQYPAGKPNESYEILNTTKLIMPYGFAGNFFIKDVDLPEGLEEIKWYAFSNTALTSITFPSTLKTLGKYAFRYSKSIDGTVIIPKGLINIGTSAFSTIASEFVVEDGNPNYKAIDGVLFTKDGTTLLAYPASNANLTYNVPTGVTEIGEGAFMWTKYAQEIKLSDTVTAIGPESFSNFIHAQSFSITIPASVKNIAENAFKDAKDPIIYGKVGSAAETFANKHNFAFEPLN